MFTAECGNVNLIIFSSLKDQCQAAVLYQPFTGDLVLLAVIVLVKRAPDTGLVNACRHGSHPLLTGTVLCPPSQDRAVMALYLGTVFDDEISQLGYIVVEHINVHDFQKRIHLAV